MPSLSLDDLSMSSPQGTTVQPCWARLPLSMMHLVLLQEAELQRLKLQQQQGSATAAQPPPFDNSKVRISGRILALMQLRSAGPD